MANETIELRGHIVDSLLLAKVLDAIVEAGVTYDLAEVEIGRTNTDPSVARTICTKSARFDASRVALVATIRTATAPRRSIVARYAASATRVRSSASGASGVVA